MAVIPQTLELIVSKLSNIYATTVGETIDNFKEIEDWLNQLRAYVATLPQDSTLTQEQINEALAASRKIRTIPYTLGDGGLITYSDGATVTRTGNSYVINAGIQTSGLIVTSKKVSDGAVFSCGIKTVGTTITVNVFTILEFDINIIYI